MKLKLKLLISAFIIISSIYLINITSSRYISEINSKSNINVAIPQIELDTNAVDTSNLILPGDTQSVEFNVKNYENTSINEVLMNYYIELNITKSDIPLTYKIYEITDNSETELNETAEGYGPIKLNYGTEEEKKFKIVFLWDEIKNNTSYASKDFKFEIKIKAEQVI